MKKVFSLFVVLFMLGCATVPVVEEVEEVREVPVVETIIEENNIVEPVLNVANLTFSPFVKIEISRSSNPNKWFNVLPKGVKVGHKDNLPITIGWPDFRSCCETVDIIITSQNKAVYCFKNIKFEEPSYLIVVKPSMRIN